MSYWIQNNNELTKEVMQKRIKEFENIYFSVYSVENLNKFNISCFSKCVNFYGRDTLSSSETSCIKECKSQAKIYSNNLINNFHDMDN